jgi:hypothetical protein
VVDIYTPVVDIHTPVLHIYIYIYIYFCDAYIHPGGVMWWIYTPRWWI